jgi:hypothetical protein
MRPQASSPNAASVKSATSMPVELSPAPVLGTIVRSSPTQ